MPLGGKDGTPPPAEPRAPQPAGLAGPGGAAAPERGYGYGYGEPEPKSLRDFVEVLSRHRWSALLVFAVAFAAGAIHTLRATPVYQCSPALLEVTSDGSGISTIRDVFEREYISTQNFETQLNLLTSQGILRLAWESTPEVRAGMGFEEFTAGIRAAPVRASFLVRISCESPYPDVNAAAANAVARTFIAEGRRQREARTSRASVELDRRRDELRKRFEEAEKRIAEFRTSNQVADVRAAKEGLDRLVADFEARLDQQQVEQVSLEKAYREVEAARAAGNPARVGDVQKDAVFQELEASIRKTESERFRLLREYREDARELKPVDQELEALRARRKEFVDSVVARIETNYENARKASEKIRDLRDQRRAEQQGLARLLIEQTNLEADRDRLRRDLDDLVNQANAVQGSTGFDLSPAILHEEARRSDVQVRPQPARDVPLWALLALLLGVATAFLLEQFDDAASRPEEVTRVTGLPVLGMLPRLPREKAEAAAIEDPNSEMAEAVRIIRTAILFSPSGRAQRKRLLVTSAETGEGKTLLSVNLAAALAQAGQRTLLIDADLRKPRVHKVFNLSNLQGLSNVFADGQAMPSPVRPAGVSLPLDVLPAGPLPPNPAELLGGERMGEFLAEASLRYDRIIVDSPPAGPVSDPALLSRQVDGVLVVVQLGKTSIRAIRRAVDHLNKVGAPVLGVVLNGVSLGGGYYYYYYRRYGYYGSDQERPGGDSAGVAS
jgi:capsular exopolysaccharide synthesis family protein